MLGASDCYPRAAMKAVLSSFLSMLRSCLRSQASMQIEILALRHQLAVLQRWTKRPTLRTADRFPLGDTFADMGAVVLSVGHRQAGNGNCVAA